MYGSWSKDSKNESKWWKDLRTMCAKGVGRNWFNNNVYNKFGN